MPPCSVFKPSTEPVVEVYRSLPDFCGPTSPRSLPCHCCLVLAPFIPLKSVLTLPRTLPHRTAPHPRPHVVEQLTSQLEDTRASLKRAERRATATADVRRRDAEAAAAAAAALSAHLEASATATGAACVEGVGDGVGDGGGDAEAAKQQQHDSTATFVDLSGRWCGNEVRERAAFAD